MCVLCDALFGATLTAPLAGGRLIAGSLAVWSLLEAKFVVPCLFSLLIASLPKVV
jgi:hypothetical protein